MVYNPDYLAQPPPAAPNKPDTVAGQLTGLLSKDSNYMAAARTGARQTSEQRGLLNSSIAATAGEAAAIKYALPIAKQDAATAAASNLSGQQFRQQATLGAEGAQQRGKLLTQDVAGQSQIQSEGAAQRSNLLTQDIAGKTALQNLDTGSKERIAALNVAAGDKQTMSKVAALFQSNYAGMFRQIASTPDIPAAMRSKYLTHIAAIRDSSMALLEQMFAVNLTWQSPGIG